MGFNTTVVVMNDALEYIRNDPEFGSKLADAALRIWGSDQPEDVSAGCFINAATVIESHHADGMIPVLVGGNHGTVVKGCCVGFRSEAYEMDLLKALANKLGYRLTKK
jgi:hypothetical protein